MTPPPLRRPLPPPPTILPAGTGGASTAGGGGEAHTPLTIIMRSPQEVLSTVIPYIPTYFVPLPAVGAIMPEDIRDEFHGRGKLLGFLRKYPFFFDISADALASRFDVRLRADVAHPQRGSADEKFCMTDVGESTVYIAKPEYIVNVESLDLPSAAVGVAITPHAAPPAVRVDLEEPVPVVARLKSLLPPGYAFASMELLEESLPEDVLYHPYFDCQGGLAAIASKLPEHFQVVRDSIRVRPPHIAPLALGDATLSESELPDVAEMVQKEVCEFTIPRWVSLTPMYEQLTATQKREIKSKFKSFASFLRTHGRSLSISSDMLQVAKWIPPTPSAAAAAAATAAGGSPSSTPPDTKQPSGNHPPLSSVPPLKVRAYSRMQLLNTIFDRFPSDAVLSINQVKELLPNDIAPTALPKRLLPWLATFSAYFTIVDLDGTPITGLGAHGEEHTAPMTKLTMGDDVPCVRRRASSQPLDLAWMVYRSFPADDGNNHGVGEEGCLFSALLAAMPTAQQEVVKKMGGRRLAGLLPSWLKVVEEEGQSAAGKIEDGTDVRMVRLRTSEALQQAIASSKVAVNDRSHQGSGASGDEEGLDSSGRRGKRQPSRSSALPDSWMDQFTSIRVLNEAEGRRHYQPQSTPSHDRSASTSPSHRRSSSRERRPSLHPQRDGRRF